MTDSRRTRGRRAVWLIGGALALLISVSLAVLTSMWTDGDAPPSIVLIVVDTLRSDHMGVYGHERDTTPGLDRLASEGTVFEHAFSTASWTLPSVSSILTGRWPTDHGAGVRYNPSTRDPRDRYTGLDDTVPTLAETLRAAGYTTGAFVNTVFVHPRFGFDRGFDHYDYEGGAGTRIRGAGDTVAALQWIDANEQRPVFVLVHVFDVHRHYFAPPPFRGKFTEVYREEYGEILDTVESRTLAGQRGDRDFKLAAYDEEIAYVDSEISRFLEALRTRGLYDDSIIALTADHGEAFGEHGESGHQNFLYGEVLRVPLLLWGPEVPASRSDLPVSTVDIAPTLAAAAGLELPGQPNGISLWPFLAGAPGPERSLIAEHDVTPRRSVSVLEWPYKLILNRNTGAMRLFDLSIDPGEQFDLATRGETDAMEIAQRLRAMANGLRRRRRHQRAGVVVDDLEDELRALGYVQ